MVENISLLFDKQTTEDFCLCLMHSIKILQVKDKDKKILLNIIDNVFYRKIKDKDTGKYYIIFNLLELMTTYLHLSKYIRYVDMGKQEEKTVYIILEKIKNKILDNCLEDHND